MKKVRTVLCFVLIAMLMLGALPLTAFAEEKYIAEADVYSLDAPIAGRMPDYNVSLSREDTGDEFPSFYQYEDEDSEYIFKGIRWHDDTDEKDLKRTDTFIEGHQYTVYVLLKAGYEYYFRFDEEDPADNTEFKINHGPADEFYAYYDTNDVAMLKKTFTCVTGSNPTIIDTVYITTPELVGGKNFPFTAEILTDGVSIYPHTAGLAGGDIPLWHEGICYGINITPEDTVTAGKEYRFDIYIQAEDGYEFPVDDDMECTVKVFINGEEATLLGGGGDTSHFTAAYLRMTSSYQEIAKVDCYSIDAPVAGRTPDYECAYNVEKDLTRSFARANINDEYTVWGISWYDETDNKQLRTTDTFVKGHEYTVTIVVEATENFLFNFDEQDQNANTWFYINHEFAPQYYELYDTLDAAVLKKTFTCTDGDPMKIISDIYITAPELVVGQKASFTAEVGKEGMSILLNPEIKQESLVNVKYYNGVSYLDNGTGKYLTPDDIIEPNTEYTFGIAVQTDPGYELLSEEGTEVWEPDVYFNGVRCYRNYFAFAQVSDDYLRTVFIVVKIKTGPAEDGWSLDIEMDEPVLGGTPDRDITVTSDRYTVAVSHIGYVFDGAPVDEANVPDDYVFRAGDRITVALYVSVFDEDNEPVPLSKWLLPTTTLNGKPVEVNYVANAVTYIQLYEIEKPVLPTVDVYDLDVPTAGRTPDYNVSYDKLDPNDEFHSYYLDEYFDDDYVHHGIEWYDVTDDQYLKPTDTFIEGHQYTVTMYVASDEYIFGYAADPTDFRINHEPVDIARSFQEIDGPALMQKTFTCGPASPVTVIDAIYVTTPELVGGSTAPFTAKVTTEGVIVEPVTLNLVASEIPYWYDGICYTSEDLGRPVNKEDILVAGNVYCFGVMLEAAEGYEFAVDKEDYPAVKIYINGIETGSSSFACMDTTHHCGGHLDLTASYPEPTVIEYPITVNLTEPKAGAHPDFTATVDEGVELNGNSQVLWAEVTAEGEFVDGLTEESTFRKGRYYMATVTLQAMEGYTFLFTVEPKVLFNANEANARFTEGAPIILATYIYKLPLNGGKSYILGDVNNDGQVKNRDALILDRYIAGWKDYDKRIINWKAADLSRDGQVKNRDALMLDRFIAGWKSYQKYIFEVIEED